MVEIIKGKTEKTDVSSALEDFFKGSEQFKGKLYIGYPILNSGGESIILDALWISQEKGIVIFDLIEGIIPKDREKHRDSLYNKVESKLKQHDRLTQSRSLLVDIEVITYAPLSEQNGQSNLTAFSDADLIGLIDELGCSNISDDNIYGKTLSVIQSVIKIKPLIDRGYVSKKNLEVQILNALKKLLPI